MMDLTSLLPFAGALFGGASSGDAKQTQSANRDPWGPTQGWLTSNLGLGQSLQNGYMANPLSAAQQAAYNNSFANTNLGRSIAGRVLPQLSSTQFFDRTNPLGRPTPLSFVGGDTNGAGTGTNGSLGLSGMSAYMPTYAVPAVSAGGNTAPAVRVKGPQMAVDTNIFGGGGYNGDGGLNAGAPGAYADTTSDASKTAASVLGMLGITGLMNSVNSKMADIGLPGYTPQSAAISAAYSDPSRAMDVSPQGNPGVDASTVGYDGPDRGGEDGDRGFAKGGLVKKSNLRGPDPKGPDEGKANLQSGEYVIKKAAVKKYGKGLLSDINNMKA